jgi:hypothetical protein
MTRPQTMTWKGREGLINLSEEINYDRLSYDELLRFARGSAKAMIPKMCAALKRENPHYSNYDIREIVTKDCISIWQKTTIVDALPDEYKDKAKAEASRKGRQMQLVQEQTSGLLTECEDGKGEGIDDNGLNVSVKSRTENGSVGPVEDVSEDFSKMNRGQDVITEKERAKLLSKELEEKDVERSMLIHEIDDLKNQVKVLREKNTPDLLKEIEEKFADQKGVLDSKKLQKISMEAGRNLMVLVERYNSILQEAVERGKPVPVGTYILTKPELKIVPVRIMVDFDRKRVWLELWEKRLQSLT